MLLFVAQACSPAEEAEDARPPDIVLVSIDTLRADHTGLQGYHRETTPYLNELAKESLVFDRAYTTDSWTLTAHMSLLTGLYPEQHGVVTKRDVLSPSVRTLAERLQDSGYHTVGLYFPGWIHPYFGFDRGFDRFEKHRNAEEAGENLARALAERPRDRPLFLFLHLFDVHNTPHMGRRPLYDPPEAWADAFLEGALSRVSDLDNVEIWERTGEAVTPAQHEALVALYDAGIRYVDAKLEEWLEGMRAEGLLDTALLAIVADHGEGLAQRGDTYGGHGGFHEEGLWVPLLLRFPDGRYRGRRAANPVSLVDLYPTILDLAGLGPDGALPGLPLDDSPAGDRLLFAQKDGPEAILVWPRKLVVGAAGSMRLYDLEEDPGELQGLPVEPDAPTPEAAALLERAAREKATWIRPGTSQAGDLNPEHDARLRSMGYAGDEDEED